MKERDPRLAKLTVQEMDLAKLKHHPRNPRRHPEPGSADWDVLRASMEHDYFDPLIWNKRNGFLVSGHLRHKIMEAGGVKRADVVVVDYDEPTHLARMSMANRGQGTDNNVLLTELLQEIEKGGMAVALAGFTREGLEQLQIKAREEMDRAFLSGVAAGAGNGQPGGQGNSENFPFVVVLDSEQHADVMNTVNAAKVHLKVDSLVEAVLGIFHHFKKTALK